MRFPLNQRIKVGYSFGQPTFYNTSHKGQDYQANYWNLYAPCDCNVTTFSDVGGGNWVNFNFGNNQIQCAHLSKYIKTGQVKEGDVVAVTGNTGTLTDMPHLHLQVKINGGLVDPEKYNWENNMSEAIQDQDIYNLKQGNIDRFNENVRQDAKDLTLEQRILRLEGGTSGTSQFTAEEQALLKKFVAFIKNN